MPILWTCPLWTSLHCHRKLPYLFSPQAVGGQSQARSMKQHRCNPPCCFFCSQDGAPAGWCVRNLGCSRYSCCVCRGRKGIRAGLRSPRPCCAHRLRTRSLSPWSWIYCCDGTWRASQGYSTKTAKRSMFYVRNKLNSTSTNGSFNRTTIADQCHLGNNFTCDYRSLLIFWCIFIS